MIENHNICDFRVFDQRFESFNELGHRDKQVIRQCMQNFSVVVSFARARMSPLKVLETGAGLSTLIFSHLLSLPGEKIKTIDAFALDAIQTNTRGTSAGYKLSQLTNCEVLEGITVDFEELSSFYDSCNSTILSQSHQSVLENLDVFINIDMDDRRYQRIATLLKTRSFFPSTIRNYFLEHGLFSNDAIKSYRTDTDEFSFLKKTSCKPILRDVLKDYVPNIIYLDSGEFSSSIEFNIIDELAPKGTLLLVQDIFFPKAIKAFLIASAILNSERWRVLWVDRTTPQGMIICEKI
jgi:hypothetical protein